MAAPAPSPFDSAWLWLARVLSVVAWLAGLNYVVWRWRRVLQTSYWLSLPFIVSEGLVILLGSGLFYFQIWRSLRRRPYRLSTMGVSHKRWPSVDVLVPTYQEPVHVIERTLRAALQIHYPPDKLRVHLLDDGGSMTGRELVDRLNRELQASPPPTTTDFPWPAGSPVLRYIARLRKPGQPHHAKAGNLNHAIFESGTSGDYLLILDCDMVSSPEILDALLPHVFTNQLLLSDKVAMVQSPQSFFNVPEHDPLNDQSVLFYQVLMPGWDAMGATPCCGTNVIFQRRALEAIGGFSYGSITEDFLTSCNLASRGYVTKYTPEVLASGLAPDDLDSFFSQRLRWAVGGLQIWRYFNPLMKRGLTASQRLLYTWAGAHYLLALPTLLLVSTPLIFLLDDGKILLSTGTALEYLAHFLPFYACHMTVSAIAHRRVGWRYFVRAQEEAVYLLFNHIKACGIALSGVQLGFQVTRKDGIKSSFLKDLPYVLPHLVFLLVGAAAFSSGVVHLALRNLDRNVRVAYGVNLLWAAFVMAQMWPPVGVLLALHRGDGGGGGEKQGEAKAAGPYSPIPDKSPVKEEEGEGDEEQGRAGATTTTSTVGGGSKTSPTKARAAGGGKAAADERTPILQQATSQAAVTGPTVSRS